MKKELKMKNFLNSKLDFKLGLLSMTFLLLVSCSQEDTIIDEELSEIESVPLLANATTPVVGGIYTITSAKSGRVVSVLNGDNSNGADIVVSVKDPNTSATQRQWEVISIEGSYIRLKCVDSGKSMTVANGSNNNGANVRQWAYSGAENHQWQIISVGGGYYRIKGRDSGKSLRCSGSSAGSSCDQYAYKGWKSQKFYFTEVGETSQPPTTGDADVPSDLMSNCNQWKITYPDGEEDKTLCGEDNNEYFYVNNSGNGIVFRAPIRNGNGTTPNSSYIRSELRERKADGSSDIYWTTDGTHVIYVKQAITNLPDVKDHLVATQIHGDKSAGIDDAMVLRLEGDHLFLSFNGGELRDDLTIKRGYSLGTTHEVIFEVKDGKHYCYYSENGNLKSAYASGNASQYLVKDGNSSVVMDKDYDGAYFKIGNYTQSNYDIEGNRSNNYGEVVVYDFYVDH